VFRDVLVIDVELMIERRKSACAKGDTSVKVMLIFIKANANRAAMGIEHVWCECKRQTGSVRTEQVEQQRYGAARANTRLALDPHFEIHAQYTESCCNGDDMCVCIELKFDTMKSLIATMCLVVGG